MHEPSSPASGHGHRIYRCDWRRENQRITLWLIDDPEVQVTGNTLEECRLALGEVVAERYADPHAITEFAHAHPSLSAVYAWPEIRVVLGQGSAHCKTPLAQAFSGGQCKVCGRPVGTRTDEPLTVVKLPEGVHTARIPKAHLTAYAEELLQALGVLESSRFEFRPIQTLPRFRTERRFFELIAKAPAWGLQAVGAAGLPGECTGWACAGCGAFDVLHETEGDFLRFVAAEAASTPFLYRQELCVEAERWRQACRQLGIEGNETAQLGLVPRDRILMPTLSLRRSPAEFGIAVQLQLG
jgi:hypothetical protein